MRQLAGLIDSGAGATFLTSAHGRLWPQRGSDSIAASDAQGNFFVARGGAALWGRLRTADGRDISKLVSKRAYVSGSVAEGLIALSDMNDVGWRFVEGFDSPPFLVECVGDGVVLTRDGDGHLWLEFDEAAAPLTGTDPAAAVLLEGEKRDRDDDWADVPFHGTAAPRAAAVPSKVTVTSTAARRRRPRIHLAGGAARRLGAKRWLGDRRGG